MDLSKLPLIGLIIGIVGVVIAVVALIGVSVFFYKKVMNPAVVATSDAVVEGPRVEEAVILEARETGPTVREHSGLELLLEVRPEHGQPFQVRINRAVYRLHIPLYTKGARLKVTYPPDRPADLDIVSTPQPPAVTQTAPAQRLQQLEALREKGLITDEEYQRKREEILKEF